MTLMLRRVGQEALKEYKQDHVTYSVAEIRAKYGYKLEFSKRFDRQFSKLDKSTQRYIFLIG